MKKKRGRGKKIKREEEKLKREEKEKKRKKKKIKKCGNSKICKKREYLSKVYYAYINYRYDRNEYWRKDDFTDSINSSGNFF